MSSANNLILLWDNPPFLAVLTEPDACSSAQRIDETIHAVERATVDGGVKLVVVRVDDDNDDDGQSHTNKWNLLKRLADLKQKRLAEEEGTRGFLLVVNNDVELVLKAISCNIAIDGVHVKEYNANLIPDTRRKLQAAIEDAANNDEMRQNQQQQQRRDVIIGTSCHSIQSALDSYNLVPRGPDYLFVGTCYLTQSHPEKISLDQLEGPTLPGRVRNTLYQVFNNDDDTGRSGDDDGDSLDDYYLSSALSSVGANKPPIIFAIGGIDEQNCNEPVKYGADGVATIRTVMKADDPRVAVRLMNAAMRKKI